MNRFLSLFVVLCVLQPLPAGASAAFDQAVQQYKLRKYSVAIAGFQSELRSNPSNALAHYYMALCYQGTNQIAQARQEYEWVASSNNAQLRGFASTGLANLSKYKTTYTGYSSGSSPAAVTSGGGGPKIVGRLKVIEFYTDW